MAGGAADTGPIPSSSAANSTPTAANGTPTGGRPRTAAEYGAVFRKAQGQSGKGKPAGKAEPAVTVADAGPVSAVDTVTTAMPVVRHLG
jgi:hypothetical protein